MRIIVALVVLFLSISCGNNTSGGGSTKSEFQNRLKSIESKSFKVTFAACENAELKTQVDMSGLRVFSDIFGPCHSQLMPKTAVFNCSETNQYCITEKIQNGNQYILRISSNRTLAVSQVMEESSGEIKVFSTEIWYPK